MVLKDHPLRPRPRHYNGLRGIAVVRPKHDKVRPPNQPRQFSWQTLYQKTKIIFLFLGVPYVISRRNKKYTLHLEENKVQLNIVINKCMGIAVY